MMTGSSCHGRHDDQSDCLAPVIGSHDDQSDSLIPGFGDHDEDGARLSELLVTVPFMAPDCGKSLSSTSA